MLPFTVRFGVKRVTVPVLLLILMYRTFFAPVGFLALALRIINRIIFQSFLLPEVLAGLLAARAATTVLIIVPEAGVLACTLAAMTTVKISWHDNL